LGVVIIRQDIEPSDLQFNLKVLNALIEKIDLLEFIKMVYGIEEYASYL